MGEWNKRLLEGADQLGKCWKHFKAYVVYRGKNELAKMASKWAKSTSQKSKSTGIWLVDHRQVRALNLYQNFAFLLIVSLLI